VTVRFTAAAEVAAPPAAVWARLVDWPAHARWFPATTITVVDPGTVGLGSRFVALTGVGRVRFADPMRVVEWSPPRNGRSGRCTLDKEGPLLRGRAWLDVLPTRTGCRVTWSEELQVAPRRLTALVPAPLAASSRALFGHALRAMAREIQAER
jgi:carbon monoxide dehydrogenase subunit G